MSNTGIICFSGWGQKYDSLEFIFSDPFFVGHQITSIDYLSHPSFENFSSSFKNTSPSIVIAWSLGAMIASRLISQGQLSCDLLVLISPPFQFVADEDFGPAMSLDEYSGFFAKFARSEQLALTKFAKMIAHGDSQKSKILPQLTFSDSSNLKYWLEYLGTSSCLDLDFANFPKTLIISGKGDILVDPSQSDHFKQSIKPCQVEIIDEASHAVHHHDPDFTRQAIIKSL